MADKYFTNIEDLIYSFVEYIPLVGSVYSFYRAEVAYRHGDMKRHWQTVANFAESVIRDVVLFSEIAEPATVVVIHTMSEAFTDKLIEIYASRTTPQVQGQVGVKDKTKRHVIIAGSTKEKADDIVAGLFQDKAKGIHYFHRSRFLGKFVHPQYAPNGEDMCLRLPQGIYEGAPCYLMWKWTTDPTGAPNKPDQTYGRMGLYVDETSASTKFLLDAASKKPPGNYSFYGDVIGVDTIDVYLKVQTRVDPTKITLTRVGDDTGTSALLTVDVL